MTKKLPPADGTTGDNGRSHQNVIEGEAMFSIATKPTALIALLATLVGCGGGSSGGESAAAATEIAATAATATRVAIDAISSSVVGQLPPETARSGGDVQTRISVGCAAGGHATSSSDIVLETSSGAASASYETTTEFVDCDGYYGSLQSSGTIEVSGERASFHSSSAGSLLGECLVIFEQLEFDITITAPGTKSDGTVSGAIIVDCTSSVHNCTLDREPIAALAENMQCIDTL